MRRKLLVAIGTMAAIVLSVCITACGASSSQSNASSDVAQQKTENTSDATSSGTDAQSEKPIGVSINLADDSILTFNNDETSSRLVQDMKEGNTPKSCTVLYDQMGARPSVTVTDARTIRNVYKKLARMRVAGETNMSMTDSYHLVSFELQDGTTASYRFEGEGVLVQKDHNYAVEDRGGLWAYVQTLQERYIRDQSAGSDALTITLEDEDELVEDCPNKAKAGDTVQVVALYPTDVELHASVNGDESFGTFSGSTYEFVMPNEPVTVRVWTTQYEGFGGA